MLTKEDYANLAALISRASINGLQEASIALILFQKLQVLAAPDAAKQEPANPPTAKKLGRPAKVKEEAKNGTDDTKNGDK